MHLQLSLQFAPRRAETANSTLRYSLRRSTCPEIDNPRLCAMNPSGEPISPRIPHRRSNLSRYSEQRIGERLPSSGLGRHLHTPTRGLAANSKSASCALTAQVEVRLASEAALSGAPAAEARRETRGVFGISLSQDGQGHLLRFGSRHICSDLGLAGPLGSARSHCEIPYPCRLRRLGPTGRPELSRGRWA